VLAIDPMHPGANHYLVHALEASPYPEDGLAAAERPPTLMPAAGHLLHMPAHMEGRRAEAVAAVDRSRQIASDAILLEVPGTDWYVYDGPTIDLCRPGSCSARSSSDRARRARLRPCTGRIFCSSR